MPDLSRRGFIGGAAAVVVVPLAPEVHTFWDIKADYVGLMQFAINDVRNPQAWANNFLSQTMRIMNVSAKGGIGNLEYCRGRF